ncbi:glycosyltransferase family 2 protein [Halobaculum halobium]|uniref:Glycosyltransferase family 2 protein n=1 Tax=Halobaculum halobium TaxID=3032281 RepID=A0ABD5T5G6_9EURY|nr:glycosyltransferase family 2 protein [Halobaculum sp. SYNS20]
MTYRDATVGVVIPAYNEMDFVGDVIEGLPTFVDRVYPVDDSSDDDTWSAITETAEQVNDRQSPTKPFDRVVVPMRHTENRGAGAAALTGYRAALNDDLDVVASLDGDDQMDPAFLPNLLDPVVEGRVAYAKGDRLASREYVREMSRWRLFGNLLLTGLTRVASGYWRLRDPQNGYTAVSTDVLDRIDLDRLYEQYGFRNDVLVHLSVTDCRVADVPHPARYGDETSGIVYSSFAPNLSILLARRFLWRLGRQSVAGEFGPAASFVAGIAGLAGAARGRVPSLGGDRSPERAAISADGGRDQSHVDVGRTAIWAVLGLFLLCLGSVLDARRRTGSIVRVRADADSERHADLTSTLGSRTRSEAEPGHEAD